jgi:hypothetical protein
MSAINTHFPKPATPGANPTKNVNRRDAKSNPATPSEGHNKEVTKESNKKVKVVKRQGVIKKDMSMFYLINVDLLATDIFPRDLDQKVCPDFTCKGKECTREPCSFSTLTTQGRCKKQPSKQLQETLQPPGKVGSATTTSPMRRRCQQMQRQ